MATRYSIADAEAMRWPVLLADVENAGIVGVALNRPVCVVGGRCLVHLPLESPVVSKSHALLVQDTDGVYLRDLASKNKTYVNGRPVRDMRLDKSDLVQFGDFAFRCHSGFAAATGDIISLPVSELWLQPDGLGSRQVVSLKQRSFLIGSRRGCDLLLAGEDIALAHAVIFARDGHRYLRDLSTMTGTTVNGNRIREIELHADDEIQVGMSRIVYHPIDAPAPASPVSSDGTVIGFAEEGESVGVAEVAPAAAEQVQFQNSDDEPPTAAPSESGKQKEIVLPWDDPEPIELELADSHHG